MGNGMAAFVLGAYLIAVAWRGNGKRLFDRLKEDKGFIPWAIAFVILWLLYRNTRSPVVSAFLFVALAAFFLQAGDGFWKNFNAVMSKLKSYPERQNYGP